MPDSVVGLDSGNLDTDYAAESFALFGQATHELSESTRLTLQLRGEYYAVDVAADGDFYGTFDYSLGSDDTLWGGNITLEHDLSDTMLGHITLNRGYKAGGVSTPNFTGATDISYDNETLWTAEAGIRATFLDEQLETTLNFFYIYREDPNFATLKAQAASSTTSPSMVIPRNTSAWKVTRPGTFRTGHSASPGPARRRSQQLYRSRHRRLA